MANVVSIQNAEHYTWGDNCDGWFLLKDQGVYVIQERMHPGTGEKLHVHNRSRQFFYVLCGELTMALEQQNVLIRTGEGLEVEPKVPHQARNNSQDDDVEFIVISCPPSHDDRTNID